MDDVTKVPMPDPLDPFAVSTGTPDPTMKPVLGDDEVERIAAAIMRALHPGITDKELLDPTPYRDQARALAAAFNEINIIGVERTRGDYEHHGVTIDPPIDITPAPPPPDHVVAGVTIKPPAA